MWPDAVLAGFILPIQGLEIEKFLCVCVWGVFSVCVWCVWGVCGVCVQLGIGIGIFYFSDHDMYM